jgi:hypothetical protein
VDINPTPPTDRIAPPDISSSSDDRPSSPISAANSNNIAFQSWFGESKVVDESGKPKKVFHGSRSAFDAFDMSKAGSNIDSGFMGTGSYFTDNSRVADYYAGRDEGANVADVFLNLRNPFHWGKKTQGVRGLVMRGERLPDAIHDEVVRRTGFVYDPERDWSNGGSLDEKMLSDAVRDVLMDMGYDGVVADIAGSNNPGSVSYGSASQEYVAFNPSQIKSTRNRGTWDSADDRIAYASGGEVEGPLKGQDSKVIIAAPDEYIVNAKDAQKPQNKAVLEKINAGIDATAQGIQGYHDGGKITKLQTPTLTPEEQMRSHQPIWWHPEVAPQKPWYTQFSEEELKAIGGKTREPFLTQEQREREEAYRPQYNPELASAPTEEKISSEQHHNLDSLLDISPSVSRRKNLHQHEAKRRSSAMPDKDDLFSGSTYKTTPIGPEREGYETTPIISTPDLNEPPEVRPEARPSRKRWRTDPDDEPRPRRQSYEELREKHGLFEQLGDVGRFAGSVYDAFHPGQRERLWRHREGEISSWQAFGQQQGGSGGFDDRNTERLIDALEDLGDKIKALTDKMDRQQKESPQQQHAPHQPPHSTTPASPNRGFSGLVESALSRAKMRG